MGGDRKGAVQVMKKGKPESVKKKGEIQMRLNDFSIRNIKITQQKSIRKSGCS